MTTWTNMMKMYGSVLRTGSYTFQELTATYAPRVAERKRLIENLVKGARARVAGSDAARKLRVAHIYYTCEMAPPKMNEMGLFREDLGLISKFIKCNCWKDLTVRQAWLLALVCLEVFFWLYIGECIGKCRIVGYSV